MKKLIAFCGLDCSRCEAFIATKSDDNILRDKVAKEWSTLNNVAISREMINCEGCRADGLKTPFCEKLCPIRLCALNNGSNCRDCNELNKCEKIKMIISHNKEAYNNIMNPPIIEH